MSLTREAIAYDVVGFSYELSAEDALSSNASFCRDISTSWFWSSPLFVLNKTMEVSSEVAVSHSVG